MSPEPELSVPAPPDAAMFGGEEPDGVVATAKHWVSVYTELTRFVRSALSERVGEPDRTALEQRRCRFEERLAFWTGELDQLRHQDGHRP